MSSIAEFANKNFFRNSFSDILRKNEGTYTVNKDGFVSLDLQNDEVRKAIVVEIKKLERIKKESQ